MSSEKWLFTVNMKNNKKFRFWLLGEISVKCMKQLFDDYGIKYELTKEVKTYETNKK